MNIKIGDTNKEIKKILKSESALSIGSGDLEVYSTPSMIALMEYTSKGLISKYIENDIETSVGVSLEIKHLKAAKIGETVECLAEILNVENKKIDFKVSVYDKDNILIGNGKHSRFIVDKERFMNSLLEGDVDEK